MGRRLVASKSREQAASRAESAAEEAPNLLPDTAIEH
jgi:hypothetical protein